MRRLVIAMAVVLTVTPDVQAQQRMFVTGDAFGDIKRFSGDPSRATLDGTTFGGGARVGMFVAPRVSVELGLDVGASTIKTTSVPIGVLTPAISIAIVPPISRFQSRTRNRLLATSVMLGYRPPTNGRVHPDFFGGVTFMRVTRRVDTTGPALRLSVVSGVPSARTTVPQVLVIPPREEVDNVTAGSVGFDLALDLSHLALVPEVRAHVFSLNNAGPSAFVVRPGLAVRWTF